MNREAHRKAKQFAESNHLIWCGTEDCGAESCYLCNQRRSFMWGVLVSLEVDDLEKNL